MAAEGARRAVEGVFREEGPQILAVLIRLTRDFELAEDALQDALAQALDRWPADGVPPRPGAWITTAARSRAMDTLRRRSTYRRKQEVLARLAAFQDEGWAEPVGLPEEDGVPRDDRLRLFFTCCHPALSLESQVALTLRMVGGLTTDEIARALLARPTALAQRLVRAKQKIRDAGIPFRVPAAAELPERRDAVLAVLYLVFNEGYTSTQGDRLIREDLCQEAIRLTRLLHDLLPEDPEVEGLLALMLLHAARTPARVGPAGELVVLEEQDRSLWDRERLREGVALVERALKRKAPGVYQVQAAIAALHAEAPNPGDTDWPQIAALYTWLLKLHPSPVVELNRAVALGMAEGAGAGLALLDELAGRGVLESYHLLEAARADLLFRDGRVEEAGQAYRRALEQCRNEVERGFLARRLAERVG